VFGVYDYKTLYITASNSLYRIRLKILGVQPGRTGSNFMTVPDITSLLGAFQWRRVLSWH
jgi:hypothetical protein